VQSHHREFCGGGVSPAEEAAVGLGFKAMSLGVQFGVYLVILWGGSCNSKGGGADRKGRRPEVLVVGCRPRQRRSHRRWGWRVRSEVHPARSSTKVFSYGNVKVFSLIESSQLHY
jgi:hypothetical protein